MKKQEELGGDDEDQEDFGEDERIKEIDMEIDEELKKGIEDDGINGEEFDETKALQALGEDLDLPSEAEDNQSDATDQELEEYY